MSYQKDLLIQLVLISLPSHFSQFKISSNCQKERNGLLMSSFHIVCKKRKDWSKSAHVVSTSKDKDKRKGTEESKNEAAKGPAHKRNKINVTTISFVVRLGM